MDRGCWTAAAFASQGRIARGLPHSPPTSRHRSQFMRRDAGLAAGKRGGKGLDRRGEIQGGAVWLPLHIFRSGPAPHQRGTNWQKLALPALPRLLLATLVLLVGLLATLMLLVGLLATLMLLVGLLAALTLLVGLLLAAALLLLARTRIVRLLTGILIGIVRIGHCFLLEGLGPRPKSKTPRDEKSSPGQ
jgi:hypothetical protein